MAREASDSPRRPAAEAAAATGLRLCLRGRVQGVGMRPFVWRLARAVGIRGSVWNEGGVVVVEAWGEPAQLEAFQRRLSSELPPPARLDCLEVRPLEHGRPPSGFRIRTSTTGNGRESRAEAFQAGVSPDLATCPECLAEMREPAGRRHGYAFTACSHCGPRLSVLRDLPYDRSRTSMAPFTLCGHCRREYRAPGDRRFHAQAIACPACGPRLWLVDAAGRCLAGGPGSGTAQKAVLERARRLLAAGHILAVKGLGGFHLLCDAGNEAAVRRLRARKGRPHKPFALMAPDVERVRRWAEVDGEAAALLQSCAAPVVLLPARPAVEFGRWVAPDLDLLGFALPYTPLHHLLLEGFDGPLVFTSGNRSGAPPCTGNDEARSQLAGIADFWLLHDRDIVHRLDDSVLRVMAGRPRLLRRARGWVPQPLSLPPGLAAAPAISALGGDQKHTFSLSQGGQVLVGPHVGDLGHWRVQVHAQETWARYRALFRHRPRVVAVDLHPDYLSRRLGETLAREMGASLVPVQHHHAHVAAVMAEHGLESGARVLGVVLDGLGYGSDGGLWGGEFLEVGYRDFRRLAAFSAVPMPGGERAAREPWRNAYAHLHPQWQALCRRFAGLWALERLAARPVDVLARMLAQGFNSPPASSAGRLFDAAAALLGLYAGGISYEGQAAMALEALAVSEMAAAAGETYPWRVERDAGGLRRLVWHPLWPALLADLASGASRARVAARFHHTIAAAVATTAQSLAAETGLKRVVLCGGVFQNRLLLEAVQQNLNEAGLQVLIPEHYPLNDGALSLGQAAVAAARLQS